MGCFDPKRIRSWPFDMPGLRRWNEVLRSRSDIFISTSAIPIVQFLADFWVELKIWQQEFFILIHKWLFAPQVCFAEFVPSDPICVVPPFWWRSINVYPDDILFPISVNCDIYKHLGVVPVDGGIYSERLLGNNNFQYTHFYSPQRHRGGLFVIKTVLLCASVVPPH